MTKNKIISNALKLSGIALFAASSSASAFSLLSYDTGKVDLFSLGGSQHEYVLDKTEGDMTYDYGTITAGGPSVSGGVQFGFALLPTGSIGFGNFGLDFNRPSSADDCGSFKFSFSIPEINSGFYASAACDKQSVTIAGGFSYTYTQNIPLGMALTGGIPLLDVSLTVSGTAGLGISAKTGYGGKLRPDATDFMRIKGVPIPDYLNVTITPSVGVGVGAKLGFDAMMVVQAGIKGSVNVVNVSVPIALETGGNLFKRKREAQVYAGIDVDVDLSSLGGSIGLYVTPLYIEMLSFNLTLIKWSAPVWIDIDVFDAMYVSPKFDVSDLFRD
jgi:hypothetical protein